MKCDHPMWVDVRKDSSEVGQVIWMDLEVYSAKTTWSKNYIEDQWNQWITIISTGIW